MIFKEKDGRFAIKCSHCGKTGKQSFGTWKEAVDGKKGIGVLTIKDKADTFYELCPICAKNPEIIKAIKAGGEAAGW